MNAADTDEQITLSSSEYDQFKEDNTPTTVTAELKQAIQIKEQLKLFRIFDRKFINVNEKKSDRVISYFFKLYMLDAKPKHRRIIKFRPLFAGMLVIAAAWFTYSAKQAGLSILESPYTYTAIVAMVALGLILIVYVIKEFRNALVFYSEHGHAPIIELLYRLPNKREFQQFVSDLIECIHVEKSKNYYSKAQLLAAELSEHRKLRDDGALSSKEYETAKRNIMKHH